MKVTIYSKPGCHLCEDVLQIIDRLAPRYDLDVKEVNILDDEALYKQYHEKIPVVMAGDGSLGILYAPIEEPELHTYFEMARKAEAGETASVVPYIKEPRLDRVLGYFAERWLRVLTILVGVFVALPWLAPVFAALGWWGLADPIYTAYALT